MTVTATVTVMVTVTATVTLYMAVTLSSVRCVPALLLFFFLPGHSSFMVSGPRESREQNRLLTRLGGVSIGSNVRS